MGIQDEGLQLNHDCLMSSVVCYLHCALKTNGREQTEQMGWIRWRIWKLLHSLPNWSRGNHLYLLWIHSTMYLVWFPGSNCGIMKKIWVKCLFIVQYLIKRTILNKNIQLVSK